MTASLLKKLLQFESRLEKDHIKVLTKDWNTLYTDGEYYQEELIVTNSFKNSQKVDQGLSYIPNKRSRKRGYGVRWKEQNEIFDIQEIKDNIDSAMQKTEQKENQPEIPPMTPTRLYPDQPKKEKDSQKISNKDELTTNVNEEDLKERADNFPEEDEN